MIDFEVWTNEALQSIEDAELAMSIVMSTQDRMTINGKFVLIVNNKARYVLQNMISDRLLYLKVKESSDEVEV